VKAKCDVQPEEFSGQVTLVRADQLDHGDLAVVVADPRRHATEEGEGPGMAFVESRGAFSREETAGSGIAVRQRQHAQGGLVPHAGDDDLGAAEVHLALAGRVEQGHEDFRLGLLGGPDGVADVTGATRIAVFVA
jgi:hypothetical protein